MKDQTKNHVLDIRDVWELDQSVKAEGFIDYCNNGDIFPGNYRIFLYNETDELDLYTPEYCIKTFVMPKSIFREVQIKIERINGVPALFVPRRYKGKLAITVHKRPNESS